MAAVFCSSCGRTNASGSAFCQGCGAPLAAAPAGGPGGGPIASAPAQGWAQPAGFPTGSGLINPTPNAASRSADAEAVRHAKSGAVFGMLGILLSVIGIYLQSSYGGLRVSYSCSSAYCTLPSPGLLGGLLALEAVGIVISIFFILKFRAAFRVLVPHDYRFRSPASLSILAVIGIVLVLIGLILIVGAGVSWVGPCSSGNVTSCDNAVSSSLGLLLGGAALVFLGAILAIIGGIMLLVGIWRLGTRYNQSMVKIGAILLIIPFLDIAAPFLIYFGLKDAEATLGASGPMMGGGAMPFSPPPTQ